MYIYIISVNSMNELLFKKGKQNLLCTVLAVKEVVFDSVQSITCAHQRSSEMPRWNVRRKRGKIRS